MLYGRDRQGFVLTAKRAGNLTPALHKSKPLTARVDGFFIHRHRGCVGIQVGSTTGALLEGLVGDSRKNFFRTIAIHSRTIWRVSSHRYRCSPEPSWSIFEKRSRSRFGSRNDNSSQSFVFHTGFPFMLWILVSIRPEYPQRLPVYSPLEMEYM